MALTDMVYRHCGTSPLILALYARLELEEGIVILT